MISVISVKGTEYPVAAQYDNAENEITKTYATKTAVSDSISELNTNKVDKVSGSSLVPDTEITKLADLPNKTDLEDSIADAKKAGTDAQTNLTTHTSDISNPHKVTKAQVGLGSVDNTADKDKPISTATQTALDTKVDKVSGKSLSTNDYTTAEKTKLSGIAENANNYSLPNASASTLGGVKIGNNINISDGVISISVDSELSETSTNPVQNKIINSNISNISNSINSINSSISSISSTIAEMSCVYGVRHYFNNSSPTLTRIGASNLHVTLPVQSLMKRCILADDGTVVYYLDSEDSTKKADGTDAVLDGTDGQVMVEIPTHYRRCTLGTDYYDVEISLVPFTGAFKINKCYVSAYEAALDRTNSKLASVVNTTTQYRGGNNTSSWDDTYRSLLGMPVTSISTVTFHTYGTNRGAGWDMYEIDIHDTIAWLFYIEYATLNSQLAYNSELTTEGYHQGGLGNGVVGKDWTSWNSYNGASPIIPCGTTNSLGNHSGIVAYNVIDSDNSSTWGTFNVPSYRGIENPYAHIWEWTVGYMGVGNGTNQEAYRCRNRSQYSTGSLNSYYNKVGLINSSSGWIKTIVKNEYGDIIPTGVGGSDSTYFSDYLYETHNNNSVYTALVGRRLANGSGCGFGCFSLAYDFGYSSSYYGSRLCFCEKNQIIENL